MDKFRFNKNRAIKQLYENGEYCVVGQYLKQVAHVEDDWLEDNPQLNKAPYKLFEKLTGFTHEETRKLTELNDMENINKNVSLMRTMFKNHNIKMIVEK